MGEPFVVVCEWSVGLGCWTAQTIGLPDYWGASTWSAAALACVLDLQPDWPVTVVVRGHGKEGPTTTTFDPTGRRNAVPAAGGAAQRNGQ